MYAKGKYGFTTRGTDSSGTQFDVVFKDNEKGDLKIKFPDGFHSGNKSNPNEECEKYLNLFDRDTLQVALQELDKEHPGVRMVPTPKNGKNDKESFNLSTVEALSALVDKLEETFKDSVALDKTKKDHKEFLGGVKGFIDSAIEFESRAAVTANSAQQQQQTSYARDAQYRANIKDGALEKQVSSAPGTLGAQQNFTIPPPRQTNMFSQFCTAVSSFCFSSRSTAAGNTSAISSTVRQGTLADQISPPPVSLDEVDPKATNKEKSNKNR